MSETMKKIEDATATLSKLQSECEDLEKSALAHEEQARKDRKDRTQKKKDMEAISVVLRSAQVAHRIETAEDIAKKAQAEAEKNHKDSEVLKASLEAKEKELDALIANAKKDAETPTA